MKTFLAFAAFLITFALIACNKDKFQTKPRIEIKDYNLKEIGPGQSLIIRLNYYDKEGDISQALMMSRKIRLNNFPPISSLDYKADSLDGPLPAFPQKDEGEITFTLPYITLDESQTQNDTVQFRFAITDNAGNTSDTITSEIIVARMP